MLGLSCISPQQRHVSRLKTGHKFDHCHLKHVGIQKWIFLSLFQSGPMFVYTPEIVYNTEGDLSSMYSNAGLAISVPACGGLSWPGIQHAA